MRSVWLDGLVAACIVVLLLGPAIFIDPGTADPFRAPAELLLVVVAWTLVLLVTPRFGRGGGSRPGRGAWIACLASCGWLVISGLAGVRPRVHLSYAGTPMAALFAAPCLGAWLGDRAWRVALVLRVLAVAVALEIVVVTLQLAGSLEAWASALPASSPLRGYLHRLGESSAGQPFGTFGNRNQLAEWLVLVLPVLLAWGWSQQGARRMALGLVGTGGALVLVMMRCRAAAAGFVIGAVVAAGLVGLAARRRSSAVGAAAGGVLSVALAVALSRSVIADGSLHIRLVNWRAAAALWRERPIAGVGLGGFKLLVIKKLAELHPHGLPFKDASNAYSRFVQVHNDWLQAGCELGIVGVGLAVVGWCLWLRRVLGNERLGRHLQVGLIWGTTAVIVASLGGFPFHVPYTGFVFVVLLALGLMTPPGEDRPRRAWPRWVSGAVIAVAATTLSIGALGQYRGSGYLFRAREREGMRQPVAAEAAYRQAVKLERFKAAGVLGLMKSLRAQGRRADALRVFGDNADEGLGMDAVLLRGILLEETGQLPAAAAAYRQVMNFYWPDQPNHIEAASRLARMEGEAEAAPGQ